MRLDGCLTLRGEGLQYLFGVNTSLFNQSLCGCNDFDGNLSLDHLGFESLNDVLEDLGGLLGYGWVRSAGLISFNCGWFVAERNLLVDELRQKRISIWRSFFIIEDW
jgi:hypothetical protein